NQSFAILIITNLIDNAIKFTREGSVEIILIKEQLENSEQAVLTVRDSGIGIPSAFHDQIFDEFRQVSEGFGRYYEGLGIGLALSKKLLTRLQGEISLESEEGKGSQFTVRFPVCPIPVPDQEHISETGVAGTPEAGKEILRSKIQTHTILSVEDNEYNQELIGMFLKGAYHLEMVYDGESAIRFAKEKQADLILMDINLGAGIDGVNAMQKIRETERYQTVPFIAVTGYTSNADKQHLLSAGFDEFLPKPFTKQQLESMIKQTISLIEHKQ
ncbi:MAG: response regulator, partial [Bacteroidales bacterium]|nr:response regulator [Bacteroidales bacterium]